MKKVTGLTRIQKGKYFLLVIILTVGLKSGKRLQ
jgi:hypothetical protein